MQIKSVCCHPQVCLDLSNGSLTIEGRVCPKNAQHHFEPLIHMLRLPEINERLTKVIFSIRTIDLDSGPYLSTLVAIVSELIDRGSPIEMQWVVHYEEAQSYQFASDLQKQFHLQIKPLMFVHADI